MKITNRFFKTFDSADFSFRLYIEQKPNFKYTLNVNFILSLAIDSKNHFLSFFFKLQNEQNYLKPHNNRNFY